MKKLKLEEEEKEILESFERDEWEPVADLEKEVKKHQVYARNTLKKDKRINIRISSKDLEELQLVAVEDGIPYQTLISSILHRFLSGRLIEKPRQINRINQTQRT
ncbi:MAG: antitoxin [Candidatus Aegiribacteria sp.]|nr:antitoxin [Candidatus Aegiribacteria sp.]